MIFLSDTYLQRSNLPASEPSAFLYHSVSNIYRQPMRKPRTYRMIHDTTELAIARLKIRIRRENHTKRTWLSSTVHCLLEKRVFIQRGVVTTCEDKGFAVLKLLGVAT